MNRRILQLSRIRLMVVLAIAGAALPSLQAQGQCQYELKGIIQAPPCFITGPPPTFAQGMNVQGAVVGYYWDCEMSGTNHAFVWKPETGLITLPKPDAVTSSFASDINDAGFIIGGHRFPNPGGGWKGFVFDPQTQQYTYLEPLNPGISPETASSANAINNSNVVAGARVISEPGVAPHIRNGVIWDTNTGEVIDLGVMGIGPHSAARAINDAGETVGWTGTNSVSGYGFVRGPDGNVSMLDQVWGVAMSSCQFITSAGLVAGGLELSDPSVFLAFTWNLKTLTVIDLPSGFTGSGTAGLNDIGQQLIRLAPGLVPAIVQHKKVTLLSEITEVPPAGVVTGQPTDLNNAGDVLLRGTLNSRNVGLLLSPVDRPQTDLNADCVTDVHDLLMLLMQWGPCAMDDCPADFTGNGTVHVFDLLFLLANWG